MEKDTDNREQKNNELKGVIRSRSSPEPGGPAAEGVTTSLVTLLSHPETGRVTPTEE